MADMMVFPIPVPIPVTNMGLSGIYKVVYRVSQQSYFACCIKRMQAYPYPFAACGDGRAQYRSYVQTCLLQLGSQRFCLFIAFQQNALDSAVAIGQWILINKRYTLPEQRDIVFQRSDL